MDRRGFIRRIMAAAATAVLPAPAITATPPALEADDLYWGKDGLTVTKVFGFSPVRPKGEPRVWLNVPISADDWRNSTIYKFKTTFDAPDYAGHEIYGPGDLIST